MHEVGMDALITNPARTAIFADPWSIVKLVYDRVIVDIEMHLRLGGRENNWRILNIKCDEHGPGRQGCPLGWTVDGQWGSRSPSPIRSISATRDETE